MSQWCEETSWVSTFYLLKGWGNHMYCTSEKGTQYWTQQLNERKYLPYSLFNQCMCKGAMPKTLGRALGNL